MAVDLSNIDISDLAGKVIVPEGNYLLLPVKAEEIGRASCRERVYGLV